MKIRSLYTAFCFLTGSISLAVACTAHAQTSPALPQILQQDQPSYETFLQNVKQQRSEIVASPEIIAPTLYDWIHNDMATHWDATGWDFNGVSRVAGEGNIACGYFVTTILQDLGFKLDRIRLSQEPSSVMIKELTKPVKILHSRDAMINYVKTQPAPAIYIVGLDFHTGFISSGPDGVFFIHSNYINRAGVMKEPAASSAALAASNYFMIGNLTANTDLLSKWVNTN